MEQGGGGGGGRAAGGKFGVLWCEDSTKWTGYWTLYQEALGCVVRDDTEERADGALERVSPEEWQVFDVCAGQLPPIETVRQFTGFVISGSRWSSYDDLPWIKQLHDWIRRFQEVADMHGPRMVGICFGHQAIGDALGGKVANNGQFVIGVEKIQPTEVFAKKTYVQQAIKQLGWSAVPAALHLLQSHGDAVHVLPRNAELLASSASTAVEMYTIDDRILGIQGHPEFVPELVKEKILRNMIEKGKIDATEAAEVERTMMEENLHHSFLRKVLQNFLRSSATAPQVCEGIVLRDDVESANPPLP